MDMAEYEQEEEELTLEKLAERYHGMAHASSTVRDEDEKSRLRKESDEYYEQLLNRTAEALIDQKGEGGRELLSKLGNILAGSSAGLGNQIKLNGDVACRLAKMVAEKER